MTKRAALHPIPDPGDAERRAADRSGLDRNLPMSLQVEGRAVTVTCHVLDVSPQGLCVACPEALTLGVVVRMQTIRRDVPLVVAWCRAEPGEGYRCGLSAASADQDLSPLFSQLVAPASKPRRMR